jgi:hypothetical protein
VKTSDITEFVYGGNTELMSRSRAIEYLLVGELVRKLSAF